MSDLTIIVPVYNEEDCIKNLADALDKFISQTDFRTDVLFVDDGSTDRSLQYIEEACRNRKNFNYISLVRNGGLSVALKCGFDHVKTELIGYIDADLQTTPDDFHKLLAHAGEFDLVLGYREKREDSFVKRLSSRIANAIRKFLLKDEIIDTGCPLKVIRTSFAKKIPFFNGMHRFLPNALMMAGGKVKQVPVRHFRRYAGRPKYHLFNRLTGPFISTLAVWWMQRNYIRYSIKSSSFKDMV